MSYVFKENLVSSNKYSIKCPYTMKPRYIVCHNTANDASAENEVKYMISNNNSVSYHVAVDDKYAIQAIPLIVMLGIQEMVLMEMVIDME